MFFLRLREMNDRLDKYKVFFLLLVSLAVPSTAILFPHPAEAG